MSEPDVPCPLSRARRAPLPLRPVFCRIDIDGRGLGSARAAFVPQSHCRTRYPPGPSDKELALKPHLLFVSVLSLGAALAWGCSNETQVGSAATSSSSS